MTKKKVFKVEFDIEPIKENGLIAKTAGICVWWDIIINPSIYIAATDISIALAKALVNLHEFAREVTVREGYRICGVKSVTDHYQEVYV